MKDEKPYTRRRCSGCLSLFTVTEKRTADGGLRVTFSCERCGRSETIILTAEELAEWEATRERRMAAGRRG